MARSSAAGIVCVVGLVVLSAQSLSAQQATTAGVLPGEVIYPKPSKEVWLAARRIVDDLGFKHEKRDDGNQIIVTRWRAYSADDLPKNSDLNLSSLEDPARIQLHVSVFPHLEPARVAIGSILEVNHRKGSKNWVYGSQSLNEWFLHKLSERVNARPEPLSATIEGRRRQSARMLPAGPAGVCLTGSSPSHAIGPITRPTKLVDVRPIYPANHLDGGPDLSVQLSGVVTEHGTLVDLVDAKSAVNKDFVASARGAASLWRFQPALNNGCSVAVTMTVNVAYTLR